MELSNFIGCNIMIYGPTGSGKSNLCKLLLEKNSEKFDYVYVFNNSVPHVDAVGYEFLPNFCVTKGINYDMIERLWKYHQKNRKIRGVWVFDDILAEDFHGKYKGIWSMIFSELRHCNITTIFSVQYNILNTRMRANLRYSFIVGCTREVAYDGNIYHLTTYTRKEFIQKIKDLVDHNCMFTRLISSKQEETKLFKVEKAPNYTIEIKP